MEKRIVYFEELGRVNTEETFRLAAERAKQLGIRRFVIASTYGPTAARALDLLGADDFDLVFVGHHEKDFDPQVRKRVEDAGQAVIFYHDHDPKIPPVVENAYRKICEGMKVTTQCVAAAVDAGVVQEGEQVIAVAGTGPVAFPPGGGSDTATVMTAAGGAAYREGYELPAKPERRKVLEIICMPR